MSKNQVAMTAKTDKSSKVYQSDVDKDRPLDLPATINASPGEATRMGSQPKREKLWTIRWKGARLNFGEKGAFSGFMDNVTGSIYNEKGQEISTFQGQNGQADKQKDILRLSGGVKIISKEHKATLFCDKVEYQPSEKVIRAVGKVRVETANGVLYAGNEVLTTPDLTQVATPNLFKR